jgi:hypothetical protein
MRSVDFVRYLKDDLYMAGRLAQWIIHRLSNREQFGNDNKPYDQKLWREVLPGNMVFLASSLHIFEGDVPKLQREHDEWERKNQHPEEDYGADV